MCLPGEFHHRGFEESYPDEARDRSTIHDLPDGIYALATHKFHKGANWNQTSKPAGWKRA